MKLLWRKLIFFFESKCQVQTVSWLGVGVYLHLLLRAWTLSGLNSCRRLGVAVLGFACASVIFCMGGFAGKSTTKARQLQAQWAEAPGAEQGD